MNQNSEKIAVVLLNLGAPESMDDIKPFLNNLFNDPDIIDLPLGFYRIRLPAYGTFDSGVR